MTKSARNMDHAFVESDDVVARYRTNRLTPAEADAFEIHYLDCATCRVMLEADDALAQGFKSEAAEVLSAAPDAERTAPPRRSVPQSRWLAPYAIAATVLLVTTAGLLTWQTLGPREMAATRVVPVLLQRQGAEASAIDIAISERPEIIVLLIDPTQPGVHRYDVSIVNRNDNPIWTARDVTTSFTLNAERLVVSIPSTDLSEGTYHLRVTAKRDDGSAAGLTELPMRVRIGAH